MPGREDIYWEVSDERLFEIEPPVPLDTPADIPPHSRPALAMDRVSDLRDSLVMALRNELPAWHRVSNVSRRNILTGAIEAMNDAVANAIELHRIGADDGFRYFVINGMYPAVVLGNDDSGLAIAWRRDYAEEAWVPPILFNDIFVPVIRIRERADANTAYIGYLPDFDSHPDWMPSVNLVRHREYRFRCADEFEHAADMGVPLLISRSTGRTWIWEKLEDIWVEIERPKHLSDGDMERDRWYYLFGCPGLDIHSYPDPSEEGSDGW